MTPDRSPGDAAPDPVAEVLGALHPPVTVDDGHGVAWFRPRPEHRGNPGWLHGGLAATLLDHVSARTAAATLGGVPVVTGTLDLRYHRPVPLDGGLYRVEARVDRALKRAVRIRARILPPDGTGRPFVAASGLFVIRPGPPG
ncbi:MAG: PaaI family thioesterase [Acidimicrobiales bacterium]